MSKNFFFQQKVIKPKEFKNVDQEKKRNKKKKTQLNL